MPILHFKGKVLPYAPNHYRVDANEIPTVEWVDQAAQQTYKISTKLENSVIDIEFEMQAFSGADQLASMAIRAWDLARLVVDLISFQQGWGLSVILDTLVMPAGLTSTFMPKDERLAQFSTAIQPSGTPPINNFDVCYRLIVAEPPLFMALNDLIVSITLPHHGAVNCARAVEGLRVLMTSPAIDRKQAWPIFQTNLNIDRAYREYVTGTSTGPRHGDRAHIPGPIVMEVVKRSWIIMNRFLEYRKRGSVQLPLPEFPLLTG